MKCEKCPNPATVHLTEIIKGEKKELHLCEACAKEMGAFINNQFTVSELLGKLAAPLAAVSKMAKSGEAQDDVACPECGMTFAKFRESGRLGCANDYLVFQEQLVQLLEKIHGSVQHVGKVPSRAVKDIEVENRIRALKQALNSSVLREDYEEAAKLRDEIKKLEEAEIHGT